MRKALFAMTALLGVVPALFAAEVTPVFDLRFFSGQHFFEGDISALSGNLYVMASPAVKFNEKWSLIPTYTGGYQGTRDVQELAGGGTLFQDSTDHNLSFKGIYSPSTAWKLKASAGGRLALLRETKDEKWGQGLFDHQKYTGGFETEFSPTRAAGGRLAYDYFALRFPHYESLESTLDPTLSRELAGENTLNSGNHLFTWGLWAPLPGGLRSELSLYYTLRDFSDQPVVNELGALSGDGRRDDVMAAAVRFDYPFSLGEDLRCVAETGLGYARTHSNQNHFDANQAEFLEDYYDYSQMSVSPRITAALGSLPWLLDAGGGYVRRKYTDRPIQDEGGAYLTEATLVTEISGSLGVTYPVSKNFKLRALATLGWSDSNMEYEKVFRYNYKIANYLMGFSYEY